MRLPCSAWWEGGGPGVLHRLGFCPVSTEQEQEQGGPGGDALLKQTGSWAEAGGPWGGPCCLQAGRAPALAVAVSTLERLWPVGDMEQRELPACWRG